MNINLKFNIGDEVFALFVHKTNKFNIFGPKKISNIRIDLSSDGEKNIKYMVHNEGLTFEEENLFKTLEEAQEYLVELGLISVS